MNTNKIQTGIKWLSWKLCMTCVPLTTKTLKILLLAGGDLFLWSIESLNIWNEVFFYWTFIFHEIVAITKADVNTINSYLSLYLFIWVFLVFRIICLRNHVLQMEPRSQNTSFSRNSNWNRGASAPGEKILLYKNFNMCTHVYVRVPHEHVKFSYIDTF